MQIGPEHPKRATRQQTRAYALTCFVTIILMAMSSVYARPMSGFNEFNSERDAQFYLLSLAGTSAAYLNEVPIGVMWEHTAHLNKLKQVPGGMSKGPPTSSEYQQASKALLERQRNLQKMIEAFRHNPPAQKALLLSAISAELSDMVDIHQQLGFALTKIAYLSYEIRQTDARRVSNASIDIDNLETQHLNSLFNHRMQSVCRGYYVETVTSLWHHYRQFYGKRPEADFAKALPAALSAFWRSDLDRAFAIESLHEGDQNYITAYCSDTPWVKIISDEPEGKCRLSNVDGTREKWFAYAKAMIANVDDGIFRMQVSNYASHADFQLDRNSILLQLWSAERFLLKALVAESACMRDRQSNN